MEDLTLKLTEKGVEKLGAEFVEVRFQEAKGTSILVVDHVTKEVVSAFNTGFGIRAFRGGAWGFSAATSYKESLVDGVLESAVKMAKKASETTKERFKLADMRGIEGATVVPMKVNPQDIPISDKVKYVLDLDRQAKSFSPNVVNTNTFLAETLGHITISNSFGTHIKKEVSRVRAGATVYASEGGLRLRGSEIVGGTGGYEIVQSETAHSLGKTAAEKAVKLLRAKPAPSGKFTVVLDPKLVGVFVHEALGHACEADSVLAGTSLVEGKIGSKIGHSSVTILDDPTIPGLYGSYSYDDEGTVSRRRALVQNGVLKEYLHSMETASRMNVEPNGAARTEGIMSTPIVRMSNTYLSAGGCSVDEVFDGLRNGIYAIGSEYGYVIPSSGQFTFKCEYAQVIKNGEPRELVRDVALSGLITETLKNVEAIANDVGFEPGSCGKSGQSVPISTGGPHMRVAKIVVGGMR
jgi:TldD protein